MGARETRECFCPLPPHLYNRAAVTRLCDGDGNEALRRDAARLAARSSEALCAKEVHRSGEAAVARCDERRLAFYHGRARELAQLLDEVHGHSDCRRKRKPGLRE